MRAVLGDAMRDGCRSTDARPQLEAAAARFASRELDSARETGGVLT